MEIAKRRIEMKISQQELADKIGVSRSTVAMWESGASAPRAGMLLSLAEALRCSADELLRNRETT
ncbi:MAG: helix-turn-helix domain-containing protein [Anaerotruncus rubiinfantis]|jgi:transcriptional regulator with XRE-family HTH domain